MDNQLQTIVNTTLNVTIRTLTIKGEPWFVAKDVCDALEHTNVTRALERLDDDEKMTLTLSEGHSGRRGGAQMINIVNEFGLYNLILGSRKPEAKLFKRWLTHVVLPSIRKTGYYSIRKQQIKKNFEPVAYERVLRSLDCSNVPNITDIIEIGEFAETIADTFDIPFDVALIRAIDIRNKKFKCLDEIRQDIINRMTGTQPLLITGSNTDI